MAEFVKETVTTRSNEGNTPVQTSSTEKATSSQTTAYVIYFIFGAIEVLLAFRLVLKFLGASLSSPFVGMIYGFTRVFIFPFEGIFRRAVNEGIETASVLEPSTIVAMIVYAVLAWGIVKLVSVFSGEKQA